MVCSPVAFIAPNDASKFGGKNRTKTILSEKGNKVSGWSKLLHWSENWVLDRKDFLTDVWEPEGYKFTDFLKLLYLSSSHYLCEGFVS